MSTKFVVKVLTLNVQKQECMIILLLFSFLWEVITFARTELLTVKFTLLIKIYDQLQLLLTFRET